METTAFFVFFMSEHFMSYPSQTTKLQLNYPITFDGKEITELNIRRPLVRDQLIAMKTDGIQAEQDVKLYSLLASVDQEVIYLLDCEDLHALQDILIGFKMGKSKKKQSKKL